ncbi:transporter substrate-binding domain-containing protein [Carboxylicivirga sp. M1479]|uniref:transglycosylase SLT domain-containing protein n=1 Tax=Carboxylicivirga sp. M1479 TaxID=2594476 RepID=UPI001177FB6F|nr:transporter substrate-binding domain-containing protein [Carboxylicivirga sp. M1479]TRX71395.1 transporter substrate-binding domain-containing protein [Carboxylicivirga sp. M1479]
MNVFNKIIVGLLCALLLACNSKSDQSVATKKKQEKPAVQVDITGSQFSFERDWDDIKDDGVLKVLTTYSGTSYFLYKGRPMGFEYELLEKFAESQDLKVDLRIVDSIDSMFFYLNRGDVDLIAHGLTETSKRKSFVSFTKPLYSSKQVLVQKMPDNWYELHWKKIEESLLHDAIELMGDTVSVRAHSSYHMRLENLAEEIGGEIFIDTLPGDYTTEEIIEKVAEGQIKQTVADLNIANLMASYFPVLNVDVSLSMTQNMAWVVRQSSPQLRDKINEWLVPYKKKSEYYVIYNKYYKSKKDYRRRVNSDFYSLKQNQISKYDELFKKEAEKIGWDWRLLASQVYQESKFNSSAVSWAGAVGLMQIMPATAKDLGLQWRSNPELSMDAGVRYLGQLLKRYEAVEDSVQQIKFTFAAYNCGFGHVADARRLAKKYQLDPDVWDDNVEKMILALRYPKNFNDSAVKFGYLRGTEPYTYVRQIFERYEHYKTFIKE